MSTPRTRRPALREIEGDWYVRADAVAANAPKHVLLSGRSFLVMDPLGDLPAHGRGELGLYWRGTRHLSVLEVFVGTQRPLLLSSELAGDEREFEIEETNGDLEGVHGLRYPRDVLHILRRVTLEHEELLVEITVTNHYAARVVATLTVDVRADFRDVFEVRGAKRKARGTLHDPEATEDGLLLRYDGLDGRTRWTEVVLSPAPEEVLAQHELGVLLELDPRASRRFVLRARPGEGERAPKPAPVYPGNDSSARAAARSWSEGFARFRSSEPALESALNRAGTDLGLMLTETDTGEAFPLAGIPWYATPFGRDALVVAFQLLPFRTSVARSVLRYLAKRRARERDDFTDAEPGKILHELREGEMANLREVPFVPYYGTVDATPLWLCLLGAYHDSTLDDSLVRELWPAAEDALGWIDGPGDADGDGFVEYARRSPIGLRNQGWKDSFDAVHHASGDLAEGPIALVEVQAYAYGARLAFARLLEKVHGRRDEAASVLARAEKLRSKLEDAFWDEALGTYVLALDGDKKPCRIVTSNAAHVLWMGAASPERARAVAERLVSADMFSGFGIRTLSAREKRYNPMSYHNGSIWPHDNAIAACGLRRYGETEKASRVVRGLVDAAATFPLARMPELFCGFERRPGRGPVPYPVACSPQTWASGALLQCIRLLLGLSIDASATRVTFDEPRLPGAVEWLEIANLKAGEGSVDVRVRRGARFFAVELLERKGDVDVLIRKHGLLEPSPG